MHRLCVLVVPGFLAMIGCAAQAPMHLEAIADPELAVLAPTRYRIEQVAMSSHARSYLGKRVWPLLDEQVLAGQVLVEEEVRFSGSLDHPLVQQQLEQKLRTLLSARGMVHDEQNPQVRVDVEFLTSSYRIAADPPAPGAPPTGHVNAVAVRVLKAEGTGPGFLWRGHAVRLEKDGSHLEARLTKLLEEVLRRFESPRPAGSRGK